jgi:tRNA(Ile)-lysidine synthase
MDFIENTKHTIFKYGLLGAKDRVLVCVSGGPDSVALLHALNNIKDELELTLHIAHLNHMLRKEAVKEEIFVKNLGKKLYIPVSTEKKDILKLSKRCKASIEDKARQMRYQFFLKVARVNKLNKIAVAHTKDDQAETVLMRLIKGAGPRGLCGISAKRKFDGIYVIRPLIETWKREVLSFLKEERLSYRLDKTNLKNIYLRNKVRNLLLRDLQNDFNPNIKEILTNTSKEITKAYDFLHIRAKGVFNKISSFRGDDLIISLDKLLKCHDAIKSEVIRIAIEKKKGDLNKISYKNWEDMERLINFGKSGSSLDIPSITVIRDYDTLVLRPSALCHKFSTVHKGVRGRPSPTLGGCSANEVSAEGGLAHLAEVRCYSSKLISQRTRRIGLKEKKSWRLKIPGKTFIKELGVGFEAGLLDKVPTSFKNKDKTTEYFDYKMLELPLIVRTRAGGDRFKPLGMERDKKLQDFLVDEKVSRHKRDKLALVSSGDKIVWVTGYRISDFAKLTPQTKKVLCLKCKEL